MIDLTTARPGVYRTAARPRIPEDWQQANLAAVATRAALGHDLAAEFDFPDWYGGTWDALLDCLSDLSWRPAPGYVIAWTDYGALAAGQEADWRTGFEVLREAVDRRVELRLAPLYVLLLGDGPSRAPDGSVIGSL